MDLVRPRRPRKIRYDRIVDDTVSVSKNPFLWTWKNGPDPFPLGLRWMPE